MKNDSPVSPSRKLVRAFLLCSFAAIALLLPAPQSAASDYYRHVIFDNSLNKDTYYFSHGQANGQSFIEQKEVE